MKKIKAIIFDLGGVIVNLNQERTFRAFKKLNASLDEINDKLPIFKQYESGKLTTPDFIHSIKNELKGNASDIEIQMAWNSMILNVPAQTLQTLKEVKKEYKLFLLSNTNELHIEEFKALFSKDYPNETWENLFDKIYYSHKTGLSKPNAEAWQLILDENNLSANETLFIDDTLMHYKAAKNMDIHTILAKETIGNWFIKELANLEKTISE
jgi:putative hydrolase of the HAD superfamily